MHLILDLNMKRVLYIGRFNPFHLGHQKAIEYILNTEKNIDQIIIGIGTAQESFTLSNPFTASERFEFIIHALNEMKISNDKYIIIPIPDLNNNNQWVSYLISLLPQFEIIYSNNSLVKLLVDKHGKLHIKSIPLINREEWSATSIRNKMIEKDDAWNSAIPESVRKLIIKFEGVQRIQLLAKNDI